MVFDAYMIKKRKIVYYNYNAYYNSSHGARRRYLKQGLDWDWTGVGLGLDWRSFDLLVLNKSWLWFFA